MAARGRQSKKPVYRAMALPCLKLCAFAALILICTTGLLAQTEDQMSPVRSTYGITLGTPAGLNLTTSQYVGSKLGLRLSGGYWPARWDGFLAGVQLGICWKLRERCSSLLDAAITCGYDEINHGRSIEDDNFWRFVGLAGSYKWRSFFIEGGLTVGTGTYPNPQGILQVGLIIKTFRR